MLLLAGFWLASAAPPLAAKSHLTFESAPDAAPIGETIPGLRFSTASGGDWFYGDVRTGRYDAPYPRGAFAVDGSGFAWPGLQAGEGRIDFTGGTATFFEAAFSTRESLSVAAYDARGRQVAAQVLRANANTGRLDNVRLTAPVGQGIAYVLVSGTQNRWLMDNLETDAPLPVREEGEPALVTVVQQPAPSLGVPVDGLVTYSIVVTNRGKGMAKNTVITLPFNPAEVRVLDARFSREGAWVSSLLTDTLEIETGALRSGDTMTATLRMAVLPTAPAGASLGERLSFRWSDREDGGNGRSNLPLLTVADAVSEPPTYSLTVSPARATRGATYTFVSPIFAPGEPIALWYDTPARTSIAVRTVSADAEGTLTATFNTTELEPGTYMMVARGLWTNFTATAVFVVEP